MLRAPRDPEETRMVFSVIDALFVFVFVVEWSIRLWFDRWRFVRPDTVWGLGLRDGFSAPMNPMLHGKTPSDGQ